MSPPRLMDDVDAVQATIARNMLVSGDWVTARLDHVAYLEKAPLVYWLMAGSYRIFGVHDWAARLPLALGVILLCWVVYAIGKHEFGSSAGMFAGLALATCAGLFLFTRILIPDALLTLCITGATYSSWRLLEAAEANPRRWSLTLGASLGCGVLLKGLIAFVFPAGAVLSYMAVTRQLWSSEAWRRLHLGLAAVIALAIAAPWHVLATLRNPPYLEFSLHSGPGRYRGFFWFYFFNEHLLRFLNLRYPRDYNTVPRLWFWLLNLVWLFPWSVFLGSAFRSQYGLASRPARLRTMVLCWIGFVLVFFTFSTTQEYYTLPIYPALALLIGSGMSQARHTRIAAEVLAGITSLASLAMISALWLVRHLPASGDISSALTDNPEMYTLSLGHMSDLTLRSFAYLRLPLAVAAAAFALGSLGVLVYRRDMRRCAPVIAAMMVVFLYAARLALVRFDSYLGSYSLAMALQTSPPGQLIEADAYYAFSSVFFYTGRDALLLNGRYNNLEYGSYAPGAARVFIDDAEFVRLWSGSQRCYLVIYGADVEHVRNLVGAARLVVVSRSAGNLLLSNQGIASPAPAVESPPRSLLEPRGRPTASAPVAQKGWQIPFRRSE